MRTLRNNKGRREFKNTKRGHKKFWNIEWHWKPRSGNGSVKTEWGRIGTRGDGITKPYRSAGALENYVEAKVKEKLSKGYKEVSSSVKNEKNLSDKDLIAYYKKLCGDPVS